MSLSDRKLKFYEPKYIIRAVNDRLRRRFDYLRELNDFYGDEVHTFAEPFQDHSVFERFILFVALVVISGKIHSYASEHGVNSIHAEKTTGSGIAEVPLDEVLIFYGFPHLTFRNQSYDLPVSSRITDEYAYKHYLDLVETGEFEELLKKIVETVFPKLIENHKSSDILNEMMAGRIAKVDPQYIDETYADFFAAPGILEDVDIPPGEKDMIADIYDGSCASCKKTLPEISDENFLRIIELEEGGLNDIINFRLVCKECVSSKNRRRYTRSREP